MRRHNLTSKQLFRKTVCRRSQHEQHKFYLIDEEDDSIYVPRMNLPQELMDTQESPKMKTKISFSKTAHVYLIPTINELSENTNICDLYWHKDDYMQFKKEAIKEISQYNHVEASPVEKFPLQTTLSKFFVSSQPLQPTFSHSEEPESEVSSPESIHAKDDLLTITTCDSLSTADSNEEYPLRLNSSSDSLSSQEFDEDAEINCFRPVNFELSYHKREEKAF